MQVSVETIEGLGRRMTLQIPGEQIENEVRDRLKKLARESRLKGFRPGKVPVRLIERRYGKQIRDQVLNEVMHSSFSEAMAEKNLRLVTEPALEPIKFEPGQDLEFTATFEVFPDVKLNLLDDVQIEKPEVEITDQDIENMLQILRRQHVRWIPVDRPARNGDQLTIDYQTIVEGARIEDATKTGVTVILGTGAVKEEVEKQLQGVRAEEDRRVDLTLPEGYPKRELAGKPVQLELKVTSVREPQLPEVDEEFARILGVEEGGMEALRREVRQNMSRELSQAIKTWVKEQVMQALLERHPLEIPEQIISQEAKRLTEQTRIALGVSTSGESSQESAIEPTDKTKEHARRRVALGMIMGEIVKQNGLQVDADKVRKAVETIASTYEQPSEVISWYYSDPKRLSEVEYSVLEDEVVSWVMQQVQIKTSPIDFDEFMQPRGSGKAMQPVKDPMLSGDEDTS
jgi:trigger factor